jgi:hypothetical protein
MAKRKWNVETISQIVNGEQPFIQTGYTPKYKKRKVGDEWTDSKGTWKKTKNGIVSVNKQMDTIRELVKPKCSVCNMDINLFGDKVDQKMFSKTGKCFSCLDVEEQVMKIHGKYEQYEMTKLFKNKLSVLKEFRKNVIESIEYLKKDDAKIQMVCSNGEIVTWVGQDNKPLLQDAEKDLELAEKEIKDIEDAVSQMDVVIS